MIKNINSFKINQKISIKRDSDNNFDKFFSSSEYHDYFRRIPFLYLNKFLNKHYISIDNSQFLIASAGTGIDYYYLKKILNLKAKITATDISDDAIETLKIIFPEINAVYEDSEAFSFPDDSFDYSFIANALHHLPRPHLGLYELLRVTRNCLIIIEPNHSILTYLFTKLGFAQEYESSGNFVFRYSKSDISKMSKSLFLSFDCIRFFCPHYVAKNYIQFLILKSLTNLLNYIMPSLGNYILIIIKPE